MKKENVILDKSKKFAVRIIRLYQYLTEEKDEFVLSKQLLRSGTGIGSNTREGVNSISKPEFRMKMSIALKEANETLYWIRLLHATELIDDKQKESIYADCNELISLLVAIVKTTKNNLGDSNG
jgi:four helix bundle protein